eukprot:TRINITY_DN5627_c0_g1_i1.p1 TRINITY_DN5627_c0_g1~~TRINITY_DN5627_c0_g1_i1.p1  ORF type:complete len:356 (-),score=69.99 TRINITY_DN5627_c0_g1_i1:91-1158(-)
MNSNATDFVIMESGPDLYYYSGVTWSLSERPFLLVFLKNSSFFFLAPYFERTKASDLISQTLGNSSVQRLFFWKEDESVYNILSSMLQSEGENVTIGVSREMRFFIYLGIQDAVSSFATLESTYLIDHQRSVKSVNEIAILKCVNLATKASIKAVAKKIKLGTSADDIKQMLVQSQSMCGLSSIWHLVLIGENAAYPHGTNKVVDLTSGLFVLIDTGGSLYGYQSDISRTFSLTNVTDRQLRAWQAVQKAQSEAMKFVKPGVTAGEVDNIARNVIEEAGFGEYFTHRLGHGIGIQGHEFPYLVNNNTVVLEEGNAFSIEPGIYIEGEFGVRIEDIVTVTSTGCEVFGDTQIEYIW